jgi:hypothetical protein
MDSTRTLNTTVTRKQGDSQTRDVTEYELQSKKNTQGHQIAVVGLHFIINDDDKEE